jgi:hypothetical protein
LLYSKVKKVKTRNLCRTKPNRNQLKKYTTVQLPSCREPAFSQNDKIKRQKLTIRLSASRSVEFYMSAEVLFCYIPLSLFLQHISFLYDRDRIKLGSINKILITIIYINFLSFKDILSYSFSYQFLKIPSPQYNIRLH